MLNSKKKINNISNLEELFNGSKLTENNVVHLLNQKRINNIKNNTLLKEDNTLYHTLNKQVINYVVNDDYKLSGEYTNKISVIEITEIKGTTNIRIQGRDTIIKRRYKGYVVEDIITALLTPNIIRTLTDSEFGRYNLIIELSQSKDKLVVGLIIL